MRMEYIIVSIVLMLVVLAAVILMLSGVLPGVDTIFNKVG